MESKEVEVTCPCCASRLTVDALTAKVLRFRPAPAAGGNPEEGRLQVGTDWDSAFGRVRERSQESAEKLESALDRERRRERDLDELFRRARERTTTEEASEEASDPPEDPRS